MMKTISLILLAGIMAVIGRIWLVFCTQNGYPWFVGFAGIGVTFVLGIVVVIFFSKEK